MPREAISCDARCNELRDAIYNPYTMGDTTLYLIPALTPWEIQLFILYQPLHHGRYNPLSYTNPYTMGDTTLYLIPTYTNPYTMGDTTLYLIPTLTPWEIQPFILYQPLHHGRYNPLSYTNPYTILLVLILLPSIG